MQRAGYIARQAVAIARFAPALGRVGDGHRRDQRLSIGVAGTVVERLFIRKLHNLAELHDRDAGRDVLHDAEIVGDEQIGQRKLTLQIGHQVDDLRLHGDVER